MDPHDKRLSTIHRWSSQTLWAAAVQGLSSVTNFGLHLILLLSVPVDEFGRAVALLAVYQMALTLGRSLFSEPMVGQASSPPRSGGPSWSQPEVAAVWVSVRRRLIAVGLVAAVAVVGVGLLVGADPRVTGMIAGFMPLLMLQDGQRHVAWTGGRPKLVMALDVLWLVTSAVALAVVMIAAGKVDVLGGVAAWIMGGLASWMFGAVIVEGSVGRSPVVVATPSDDGSADGGVAPEKMAPDPAALRLRDLGRSQALHTAAFNLLPVVLATVVSSAAAGLVKASILPFTPILTILAGVRLVTLPALHQAAVSDPSAVVSEDTAGPVREVVVDGTDRLETLSLRLLLVLVGSSTLAVAATLVLLWILDPWLDGGALALSDAIAWGGAITVMSVAAKHLADSLAVGRRPVAVIPRRLVSLALEWGVLFAVVLFVSESLIMAAWATGVAIGTLVWLAPSLSPAGSARRAESPSAMGTTTG